MEIIKDTCYKGTRILLGNEKRTLINEMISILLNLGYTEIQIPNIQFQEIFKNKVGKENNNLMFNFKDRGNRDICLAPEYTAVIQKLALDRFKQDKDKTLFYVQECYRGENPQLGRYRQFTQLGVEVINPTKDHNLLDLAKTLLSKFNLDYNTDVVRGLDYYKEGKGFEAKTKEGLQIVGGGEYEGGVGFAIGIDRLID